MSAQVIDLRAQRRSRALRRLLRQCPRIWVPELGRMLLAVRFFTEGKRQ
jgi:hypothetical protein